MPELPDAAGSRRLLARSLHRIDRVDLLDPAVLRNADRAALDAAVADRAVRAVERRGKWLVLHVERRAALVIHLGMTGSLVLAAPRDAPHRFDRAAIRGDADVRLRDPRRLGGLWLAADTAQIAAVTGPLGPDAARLTLDELGDVLDHRRTTLKAVLTDQAAIAGLGSTTSDEVLWQARLHPRTPAGALTPEQVARLHAALRDVVRRAARAGHVPRTAHWLTSQRGLATPTCPRCHRALRRSPVSGRTALWCPRCQPDVTAG